MHAISNCIHSSSFFSSQSRFERNPLGFRIGFEEHVLFIDNREVTTSMFIAYEYAKRGARLAIIAREKPESRLKQVADTARGLGSPDVLFIYSDVSEVEECRKFVDDTIKHFGRLDHLVCNAGISPLYSIKSEVTSFEPVMIVVNASSAGILNPPKGNFYNASKAALISFYESLRYEVSPTITITILTLGFVNTNLVTAKYSTNSVGVPRRKDIGSVLPTMDVEPCTKAIVDGVCKGATLITEPRFYKALFLIKFLFPQLHSFYNNSVFPRKSKR
nr:11-beta-hydroxysteroid dehydrogenase-like 4A [Tanacetum cinerariifolium]